MAQTETTACPKITMDLHEVMVKCRYVQKSGQNKFHNYRYAGEADLLAVLRPAMVDAGLLLIPSVTESAGPDEYGNTTVKIAYTLAHKDGEVWPHPIYAMGCGNDKNSKGGIGDKGTYKAITGANKYLLFKLFQIETGDDPEHDERETDPPRREPPAQRGGSEPTNLENLRASLAALKEGIGGCSTADEVNEYWTEHKQQRDALPDSLFEELKAYAKEHKAKLAAQSAPNTVLGAG